MKILMKLTTMLTLAGLAFFSNSASATIVFDLGTVVDDSKVTPESAAPWLRATITQYDPSSVLIKMEAIALVNAEAVKDWAFNVSDALDVKDLSATEFARTGSFEPDKFTRLSCANGYAGFKFDFDFDFATKGGSAATRFTQGDSLTMLLTRANGTLTEADLDQYIYHNGQTTGMHLYSGAHIISINNPNGSSCFVGATSDDPGPTVPEPTTIVAGLLLLLPFGASAFRIIRKNR